MKKAKHILLLVVVLVSTNIFAQKVGHINANDLLLAMPERATIEEEIKKEASQLEGQLLAMQKELETKYQDFQANEANMTDAIKETKYAELTDLDKRLKDFQTSANDALLKKEKELTDPIVERAKKAIEDVAKENNFSYILDNSAGILLYTGGGEDITPLVKKKLGLE